MDLTIGFIIAVLSILIVFIILEYKRMKKIKKNLILHKRLSRESDSLE